jgi:hypothetical protein
MSMGASQFLGVWLAMKVAGQWIAWKQGINEPGRVLTGHSIFSIFLVGNGMSVAYAIVGTFLIGNAQKDPFVSTAAAVSLVIGTFCLWCMVKYYEEKPKLDDV